MATPHNIALPCTVSRAGALIAYRGFFNPQSVHLRFVTNGQVIDYVGEPLFLGGYCPSRPVEVRSLAAFLLEPESTPTAIPLDRDLSGQWRGDQVKLVYRSNCLHDSAIVFLTKENAIRLASWMIDVVFGAVDAPSVQECAE